MGAIQNLHAFIERVEHSDDDLPAEHLARAGEDLVQAAGVREGYEELAWKAGVYAILNIPDEAGIEHFYQRYGCPAIASALLATFVNGDFPLGLGFIAHDFWSGSDLGRLLNQPVIRQAVDMLQEEKYNVPVNNFTSVTPGLRQASVQFLDVVREADLFASLRLQIASALLVASVDHVQEREPATRVFLDALLAEKRDINLFYCWRAAIDCYPSFADEDGYMRVLPEIIRRYYALDDHGITLLEQLFSDQKLIDMLCAHEYLSHIPIVLGLAGWWLHVRKGRGRQGAEIARLFLWRLDSVSPLYKALMSFLDDDQQQPLSSEELERLQQRQEDVQRDFQQTIQSLHKESRLRTYRGVPLAMQIWRYNLIHEFEPLYEALEGSSLLTQDVIQRVRRLRAKALIDENPLQRETPYQPIEGKLRLGMIGDFEKIIQLLSRALDLRLQLSELSEHARAGGYLPGVLSGEDIKNQVKELCQRDPCVCWAIESFLPETLGERL